MPMKGTGIGQAWFYHAPTKAKPKSDGQVGAPPISQISDLCGGRQLDVPEKVSTKNWIKESDSEYIRLAKQGGRGDLLNMRPRNETTEYCGPVGYPRCDWFYDNAPQYAQPSEHPAEESKETYDFRLPAWMVHPEPQPRQSTDGYVRISQAGVPTIYTQEEKPSAPNYYEGCKSARKKTCRKPVKVDSLSTVRPSPCKPPKDHLKQNAIHVYPN